MRVWSAPAGTATTSPGWVPGAAYCPGDATEAEPQVILTDQEFQSLPLPAGELVVQPPGDYALIGMRTNVYAISTSPSLLTTTILGQPVQVRATPVAWSWDFGDGTVIGPSSEPGAPYPTLTHAHVYQSKGSYAITMTTTYRGEFSVSGGPWQPVAGQATVTGPPHQVTTLTGTTRLTAD